MGSRSPLSGCMRFAALASCMSCRLQRDGALAMQCGCGSLLGRRQSGLCVGLSPGSVQRGCGQGPLVHSPSVSQVMHIWLPTKRAQKEKGSHFDAN